MAVAKMLGALALVLAVVAGPVIATYSVTPGSTTASANRLARGIVKRMTTTGGAVKYKTSSATLLGGNEAKAPGNKNFQYAGFTGASTSLVDSNGSGLVLASGRATNFFAGQYAALNTSTGAGETTDAGYLEPWDDNSNPVSDNYLDGLTLVNSVALQFVAYLPVGTVSIPYAFCSDRPASAIGAVYDLVTITVRGNSVTASPTNNFNIAYLLATSPATYDFDEYLYMVSAPRFDANIVPTVATGLSLGLNQNISYCQTQLLANYAVTTEGLYAFQLTATRQQELGNIAHASSYLLVSAALASDYPDVYNATTAILSGVDTINEAETVDTWCVVGSTSDADIVPGYRVYASTLDTSAYCCRAHGLYNVSANTCVVKTCDTNNPHVYTSFLHINHVVGQHVYDCYALCTPRTGYVDSLPQSSLLPVFKTMYDNREQQFTTLSPTVSAATYAAEGVDREGIYIDSELVATTGVRLYVGTTEWLCTIRGFYLGSLSAEFKCLTVYTSFLYTPDQLAYTGCYSSTEV